MYMNKKLLAIIVLVLVIIAGGAYYEFMGPVSIMGPFDNQPSNTQAGGQTQTQQPQQAQTNKPDSVLQAGDKKFYLEVKDGKLVGNQKSFYAKKNDSVSVIVTSDVAGTFSVTSYGKEVTLVAKSPATVTFKAEKEGTFPINLASAKGAGANLIVVQ